MAYVFLSDEWIAEARAIRARHDGAEQTSAAPAVKLNVVVTGAPFDDGTVEGFIDTSTGDLVLERGHLDEPDVSVTTDYETARSIFVTQDPAAGMQAFMAGKVVVQGDMMKLMALPMMVASDVAAKQVADEIQSMTL